MGSGFTVRRRAWIQNCADLQYNYSGRGLRRLAFRRGYEVPRARFRGSQLSRHPAMFTSADPGQGKQEAALMDLGDVAHLAEVLTGVRRTAREGLAEWGVTAGSSRVSWTTCTW